MNHFHKIVLVLCVCVISCNNGQNESTSEATDSADSSTANMDLSKDSISLDTLSEDFIIDTLASLKEVMDIDKHIDKITKHKDGVAFAIASPGKGEPEYFIKVGYNGPEKFETYQFFHINPTTKQITVEELTTGETMTIEKWREFQKEQQ